MIITLGEVILGTVAALDAVVREDGWTMETALVGLAGVGLAFGMWWMYFVIPYGDLLHRFRSRSFGWGYGHLPLFASLAATGAGLHVAALSIEGEAHISLVAVVATTAVPLAVYVLCLYGLYSLLTREIDPFHLWLLAGTAVCIVGAIVLAAIDAPLAACLLVLTVAPAVTVVGYELVGHRHGARAAGPIRRPTSRRSEPGQRAGQPAADRVGRGRTRGGLCRPGEHAGPRPRAARWCPGCRPRPAGSCVRPGARKASPRRT